eukprot:GHVU01067598.1.p1 GENE.GHVU01067598.1~~GHVU01067598.1.p1  ORF type:complete len:361 (+),score=52.49 GHVU01067598.1:648-1730(+)
MACRVVCCSADGEFVVSGGDDRIVRVNPRPFLPEDGSSLGGPGSAPKTRMIEGPNQTPLHNGPITALAIRCSDQKLFTGCRDRKIRVFDLNKLENYRSRSRTNALVEVEDVSAINALALHPTGDYLLVAAADPVLRLLHLPRKQMFTTMWQHHHHTGQILDVSPTSDGSIAASASADGSIRLWDLVNMRVINRIPMAHQGGAVTSVRWSRSCRHLLSAGGDARARIWDVRTGAEVVSFGIDSDKPASRARACFLSDESFVALVVSDPSRPFVQLFNSYTGGLAYSESHLQDLLRRAAGSSSRGDFGSLASSSSMSSPAGILNWVEPVPRSMSLVTASEETNRCTFYVVSRHTPAGSGAQY